MSWADKSIVKANPTKVAVLLYNFPINNPAKEIKIEHGHHRCDKILTHEPSQGLSSRQLQNEKSWQVCLKCYWANPENCVHVAHREVRRTAILWDENEYEHFSGFEFFLFSNLGHARPYAGNANR
jgi:hypothetical protein